MNQDLKTEEGHKKLSTIGHKIGTILMNTGLIVFALVFVSLLTISIVKAIGNHTTSTYEDATANVIEVEKIVTDCSDCTYLGVFEINSELYYATMTDNEYKSLKDKETANIKIRYNKEEEIEDIYIQE